ncbi:MULTISPECIES: hypothetical protein [unclassified Bradyrhizobium]|uniref:hypothetical protein n=1 Tax=unclassified Bradyrhizobium TaxID=2631580 RepID=UPI002479B71D|nr:MULTISPECIES: hypothetical protein [unclassified Bradyrhizobium]WGS19231.1 hypothetical protein MTX22_33155 [Bradyrhizobium sp. ISRA463]WGS26068.1 hypothetical protein MTX19_30680 [Bradyrhizobium sp. ISRA464]
MELAHEIKSSSSPSDFIAQLARTRWSLFGVMPAFAAAHCAKSAFVLDDTAQSRMIVLLKDDLGSGALYETSDIGPSS